MPVLAILGSRDAMIDAAETKQRLERFAAQTTIRWNADAGHVILGEDAVIQNFLESVVLQPAK